MCVPNFTYKSILPSQQAGNASPTAAQHSAKMRNLGEQAPLSNQQLLNGYSKNLQAVNQQLSRPSRKAHQERAFQ